MLDDDLKTDGQYKYLWALEVSKKYRGYDLGTQIVNLCKSKYKIGALRVRSDNAIAIRLYKKLGFKFIGNKEFENGKWDVMVYPPNKMSSVVKEATMDNVDISQESAITKLTTAIDELRTLFHSQEAVKPIMKALNEIFGNKVHCANAIYTYNPDKLPFGCIVFPILDIGSMNAFLVSGEEMKYNGYEVEIDSKMFDYGLSNEQVAEIVLYNIYHLLKETSSGERIRNEIDDFFNNECETLSIKYSVQYQNILLLGILDSLNNIATCLNLPDDVQQDAFLASLGLRDFKVAIQKLYTEIPGCENEILRLPNLSMLHWCLRLYRNVDKERIPALHLLEKAKSIIASRLYQTKFDLAITTLNTVVSEAVVMENTHHVLLEAQKKMGMLAKLKYNGLRDIEADLYEYANRARNAADEVDVYYALRQINARIAILDDYILEYPDDPQIKRWTDLKNTYMEIRNRLAQKKLHRGAYSIVAVDYDQLFGDDYNH